MHSPAGFLTLQALTHVSSARLPEIVLCSGELRREAGNKVTSETIVPMEVPEQKIAEVSAPPRAVDKASPEFH